MYTLIKQQQQSNPPIKDRKTFRKKEKKEKNSKLFFLIKMHQRPCVYKCDVQYNEFSCCNSSTIDNKSFYIEIMHKFLRCCKQVSTVRKL